MSQHSIDFGGLLDLLVQAAYNACQIIHASSLKPTYIMYKSEADPVTQIDHTIQKSILNALQHQFSDVAIVGEEHIDETMIDYALLHKITNIAQQLPSTNYKLDQLGQESIKSEDVCIFIDPLDCTRRYICGKKWECTVLIGVTVKGKAVFGIIGQPFKQVSHDQFVYNPRLIVGGSVFEDKTYHQYELNQWAQKTVESISGINNNHHVLPLVAVSSRRSSDIQQNLQSHLSADYLSCGGSGNKLAMLIRQEVQAVIFLQTPISTWDSCAGEAIVVGLGGILTKPDTSNVDYDKDKQDQTNYEGFVCCLDQEMYKQITDLVIQYHSNVGSQIKQQIIIV